MTSLDAQCKTCGHTTGWHVGGLLALKRKCDIAGCKCKDFKPKG